MEKSSKKIQRINRTRKKQRLATGGGPPPKLASDLDNRVIDLFGDEIKPYKNSNDSDASHHLDEEMINLEDASDIHVIHQISSKIFPEKKIKRESDYRRFEHELIVV